jgi:hypothetical protein
MQFTEVQHLRSVSACILSVCLVVRDMYTEMIERLDIYLGLYSPS